MDFFQLSIIFIFFVYFIRYSIGGSINCTAKMLDTKVKLKIQYDRNELGIYKYNNKKLVNILLPFVNVTYSGTHPDIKSLPLMMHTSIEGYAVLTTNSMYSGKFCLEIQRDLFSSGYSCYSEMLCNQVSRITQDDERRANLSAHDFGENAVYYNLISQRYPTIRLDRKENNYSLSTISTRDSDLQNGLNALVDFLLIVGVSYISSNKLGIINLPDQYSNLTFFPAKQGYFHMTGGTFGDLTKILRTTPVRIINKGSCYSISIGFQLPNINISYDNYNFKYSIARKSGKASIDVDSITFDTEITVNYNSFPCNISASYIRSQIHGLHFKLFNGGFTDYLLNKVVNFSINMFTRNIVEFLQNLFVTTVHDTLKTIDCEKYRPRIY
ncbi:uncharacterized protein LOC131669927 isoform X2 [Phymastichus coffea]|uniref:uncharacterized protein LOC131669927 isoform X2 n=1 Tax=Phymastichus coffea TaxID=108790 RepID=UPI00273CC5C5|nr:uncharacterized protein LOC131669927 isoform X2 [Phymastichus coffea]